MPQIRILIVDDMRTMRTLVPIYLSGNDYEIETAESARAALKRIAEQPPDLIVSDVQMAEMDGVQLCQELQNSIKSHAIPVVLMTSAEIDTALRERARSCGVRDIIRKPIDPALLQRAVRSALELKAAAQGG